MNCSTALASSGAWIGSSVSRSSCQPMGRVPPTGLPDSARDLCERRIRRPTFCVSIFAKDNADQAHAFDVLRVFIFAATGVGVDPAILVSQRIHEPLVVAGTARQPIVSNDDNATSRRAVRKVTGAQDPQQLLEALTDHAELAGWAVVVGQLVYDGPAEPRGRLPVDLVLVSDPCSSREVSALLRA